MCPTTKAELCQATLARGGPCRWRATHTEDGTRLCGVHRRRNERDRQAPECPICLCTIRRRGCTMECGHAFHRRCIHSWFRGRPLTCPMCRATCLEGLALFPRLAAKIKALLRTVPPPPRTFFPAYMVAQLESPRVAEALVGGDKDLLELLVDTACECFTRDNFFVKIRAMGL